jgi:carboxyl-terminal processing protease
MERRDPPIGTGAVPQNSQTTPLIWRFLAVLLSGLALGWMGAMGCAASKPPRNFQLMAQAWNLIQREYVDRSAIQPKELTYGAINGMVDALGDTGHSTFLTPAMVTELKRMEHGEFKGIGVEIRMKNGHVTIVAPIDNSPAQRAGMRAGDIIMQIGSQDVTDWPISKVVERITGPPGSQVTLTILDPRTGQARHVNIVRASIRVHDVTWQELPGTRIAHLRIASFDQGVSRDLKKALAEIKRQKEEGIILDLRNNPGGILDEAVEAPSQFLNGGNVLLMKDSAGHTTAVPAQRGGVATQIPLVVLINGGSASAAEIVAGALEDEGRATLVGETTFGTGTVLGQFRLSDGSALLLAIQEWLTPKGRSFWHKGLEPQIKVALPTDASLLLPSMELNMTATQLHSNEDVQLLRALEIMSVRELGHLTTQAGSASSRH